MPQTQQPLDKSILDSSFKMVFSDKVQIFYYILELLLLWLRLSVTMSVCPLLTTLYLRMMFGIIQGKLDDKIIHLFSCFIYLLGHFLIFIWKNSRFNDQVRSS